MAGQDRTFPEKATLALVDVTAAIFADIVTDARRRVVEQGWFGQPQDGPATGTGSKLAEVGQAPEGDGINPFDPWGWNEVHTHDPHVPEALEGIGARGPDNFNAENVKNVVQEFYGRASERDAQTAEAQQPGDHPGVDL